MHLYASNEPKAFPRTLSFLIFDLCSSAILLLFPFDGFLLVFPGCPLLTTTGLSGLVQLQDLEELELTNCPGATPELFKYFSQHLPRCMVIE